MVGPNTDSSMLSHTTPQSYTSHTFECGGEGHDEAQNCVKVLAAVESKVE